MGVALSTCLKRALRGRIQTRFSDMELESTSMAFFED